MKTWIFAVVGTLLVSLSAVPQAEAEVQVDGGINYLLPTQGDDSEGLIGGNLELGVFSPGVSVDSFFGLQLLYSGDSDANFGLDTDVDYLSAMAMYRAMFGVSPSGLLRLYGEAGGGLSRTSVSINDTRRGEFDTDDYGLGYTLGAGVEVALTDNLAFDFGYNFLGMTEVSGYGQDFGGNFHALRLNLVLRF